MSIHCWPGSNCFKSIIKTTVINRAILYTCQQLSKILKVELGDFIIKYFTVCILEFTWIHVTIPYVQVFLPIYQFLLISSVFILTTPFTCVFRTRKETGTKEPHTTWWKEQLKVCWVIKPLNFSCENRLLKSCKVWDAISTFKLATTKNVYILEVGIYHKVGLKKNSHQIHILPILYERGLGSILTLSNSQCLLFLIKNFFQHSFQG